MGSRSHTELLGDLFRELARVRLADTTEAIASYLVETTGDEFSYQEILCYLQGTHSPYPKFNATFAEAFMLTAEERRRLAWIYSFSKEPGQE